MFAVDTKVRFGDTDMMGHVNNATFLTYLEDARVTMFRGLRGADLSQSGMILARVEIDFVRPAFFGVGPVRTEVWVESVGTKSFRLGYELMQDGAVVARAYSVQVGYDYAAGASRALTGAERTGLAAYAKAASAT